MSRPSLLSSVFVCLAFRRPFSLVGLALASGLHAEAVTTEVTFNDPAGPYAAYYAPLVSAFNKQIASSGRGFLFDDSSAVAVYGGPVPLYSGYLYSLGNRAPQPGSDLLGDVMNGVALACGQRHSVSALDRAILKDTGLDLSAVAGTLAVTLAVTSPTATIGGQPETVVFRLAAPQGQDTAT